MRSCATCRYATKLETTDLGQRLADQLACRVRAPTVFCYPIPTPQGPGLFTSTQFPVVKPSDWCGEHVPKSMAPS